MQNQSKDSFPSDTKKNPKDCMAITLRSGKELQGRNEVEKNHTDVAAKSKDHNSTSSEKEQSINDLSYENQQLKEKVQTEKQTEEAVQKKKEEVRAYQHPIPFPQRLK